MKKNLPERIKRDSMNFLYDHPLLKDCLENGWLFLVSSVSALIFALGFNCFMDPGTEVLAASGSDALGAGGVTGVSQVLVQFFILCGWKDIDAHTAYSILYFVLNAPLIFLAWFGIGRKFTIFTLLNVVETSILIRVMTPSIIPALGDVFSLVNANGGMLARALFGGLFTGMSSALCFKFDFATGGIDIVAYYIALRKSTMVGRYSVIINSTSICLYALLFSANHGFDASTTFQAFARILYSVIYLFAASLVIDAINVRNKKLKIEITTSKEGLGAILVSQMPHGATVTSAKGAYSGHPMYVVTMVVSSYEVGHMLDLVKRHDERAFVQVTELVTVVGRFHMKPVK